MCMFTLINLNNVASIHVLFKTTSHPPYPQRQNLPVGILTKKKKIYEKLYMFLTSPVHLLGNLPLPSDFG